MEYRFMTRCYNCTEDRLATILYMRVFIMRNIKIPLISVECLLISIDRGGGLFKSHLPIENVMRVSGLHYCQRG